MLIFTRAVGKSFRIEIDGDILIKVLGMDLKSGKVKIGIKAGPEISIIKQECISSISIAIKA